MESSREQRKKKLLAWLEERTKEVELVSTQPDDDPSKGESLSDPTGCIGFTKRLRRHNSAVSEVLRKAIRLQHPMKLSLDKCTEDLQRTIGKKAMELPEDNKKRTSEKERSALVSGDKDVLAAKAEVVYWKEMVDKYQVFIDDIYLLLKDLSKARDDIVNALNAMNAEWRWGTDGGPRGVKGVEGTHGKARI